MTKREEVREGLIKFFTPPNTTFKGNPIMEENITQVIQNLMERLDSLGVVVKKDEVGQLNTPVAFRVAVEHLIN